MGSKKVCDICTEEIKGEMKPVLEYPEVCSGCISSIRECISELKEKDNKSVFGRFKIGK